MIPERETPGISASACAQPIPKAPQSPTSSIVFRSGRRSASQRTPAKTARKIAICHGSPRCSAISDSPAAPTSAAGTVATATTQAVRSAGLRIRLRAMLPANAPASSRMSRQK